MVYICSMKTHKTRYKIGEFSRMMQVTVKTLRHYEQKGLLLPSEVDEWTGYRYYTIEQVQRLSEIRQMQKLGFSLEEIGDLLCEDNPVPSIELLDEKIAQTENSIKALMERHRRLLDWRDVRREVQSVRDYSIHSLPEITVASHREIIPNYEVLGDLCCKLIGPAMVKMGCRCTVPGYCFTVEYDGEYRPENIDIEYCEQVEEMLPDTETIRFKRLDAVPKALCLKHIGPYDRFYESFSQALRYLEDNALRICGQPRFCYIDGAWNQPDPEKWVSIIQIPVE